MASATRSLESGNSSSQQITPENKRCRLDLSTLDFDPRNLRQIDPEGDVVLYTPERCLENDEGEPATTEANFLVSSKHLRMTSRYFKTLLSERWPNGRALATNGVARVAINDCEPDTLLLILKIIHGQFLEVPRKISFQRLVDVALAADFFECIHLVELFVPRWMNGLKTDQPSRVWSPKIPQWIMICVVFGAETTLKKTIKLAVEEGTGPLQIENLPIPGYIKEAIDDNREKRLQRVLIRIETNLINMISSKGLCTDRCQTEFVGLVTKYLARYKIFFRLVPFEALPLEIPPRPLTG